jgi:hypothetical protein
MYRSVQQCPPKYAFSGIHTFRAINAGQILREIPEKQILSLQFCFGREDDIMIS